MISFSDLLTAEEMKLAVEQTGMGVESIDFSITDNLDNLEQTIIDYRARMEYMGALRLFLHGPFLDMSPVSFDSQIRRVTEYRFEQAYEAGVRLGAEKIVFHTSYIPIFWFPYGWPERMAEFWNRFLEGKDQMQVLFENVYDPDPALVAKTAELVESPHFKLCLDIGHANHYSNVPVMDWVNCFGSHIGHVHVHDNDGTKDAHLALGAGNIPVTEVLTAIKNVAPEASYTIECNTLADVLTSHQVLLDLGIK
ncbi:MAG: sugar phosphate isomerase/epimerase [Eubacterium sp.]|nr:sugar phosphate isomerase/epimerase [Eubacterium sp.]